MARILLAANSSWNFENFRVGLIRELLREGHEVITVSPDADGVTSYGAKLRHRTWAIDRSRRNPVKELVDLSRFGAIILQERPDVVLGFTIKPNLYASTICRLFKVPMVPNVTGLGTAFLESRALRRAVSLMYRFAFRDAPTVFFQNKDDQALFIRERLVRAGQSRVLPGSGVNLDFFSPSELPKDSRFLMIARLLADKGVREYVAAARKLRKKLPSATFSLLGELDVQNASAIQKQELDAWVGEGVIDYLGYAPDVRPFIGQSTAVVLPSYREGLPRTLLEGAAMGRPLIGTDVPGCRDVVREGVTGFLCEVRNVDSLAAAMDRFAQTAHEERGRMGARARAMAEREFDERLVIGAYLEVIRALST
jgi:glycosyltransferase involved in cell wall biosynthesis